MVDDSASLLSRWRQGDQTAGRTLFDAHYGAITGFFKNKTGRDSSDLVQETFMACVANRDRIQGSFKAYLYGVAKNVLKKHLQSKYRQEREIDFEAVSIHDVTSSPADAIVQKSEQRLLLEGLRNIPISDQIMLELRYWESMTTAEIAEVLALPHATARSRLRRAKEKLEFQLSRIEA
ncbi:MAG: sigma-70 family RNA polymerase sigma factor, partial [Myxococcota bacterium]